MALAAKPLYWVDTQVTVVCVPTLTQTGASSVCSSTVLVDGQSEIMLVEAFRSKQGSDEEFLWHESARTDNSDNIAKAHEVRDFAL